MRVTAAARAGGSDVFESQTRPLPIPRDGEVLLRVKATGVNFIDTYRRSGQYPVEYPAVLGSEAAGVVVALGPGVASVRVGDRVTTASAKGAYAEFCTAPANQLVPVPDGLDIQTACAATLQGLTAHYLMTSVYSVQPGDRVLIHAGAGGVGQIAIQMLKLRGAYVISTASTPEKREIASSRGADAVLDYENFDVKVRELTDGDGVAVVFDGVGRSTFDRSLKSLRPRGTMALFGAASGPVEPFDPQRLNAGGSLILTRPSLAHFLVTAEERAWRAREVFGPLAAGEISVDITAEYPLADAASAHDALTSRSTTGKVILTP
jgi:NADPH2:quinone reductase